MTVFFWSVLAAFLALDAILLPPLIARNRRREMNQTARADAPGSFAQLSNGLTHYQWYGPVNGKVIVLVHGLTTPSFVWAGLVPILTGAGYRVLSYDLFGRGFSDRPRNRQTPGFFVRQLEELLRDQMVAKPVLVLGYSMGGGIATAYAHRHPDKVRALILLASIGFIRKEDQTRFPPRIPLIGDWLMTVFGGKRLSQVAQRDQHPDSVIPDIARLLARETRYRGYLRSVLSSLRYMIPLQADKMLRQLMHRHLPVLAIWAQNDATIPGPSAARLSHANPDARTVTLSGADHSLAYSRPKDVGREIVNFLAKTLS